MSQSPFVGRYDELRDRESAYEILKARTAKVPSPSAESPDDRTRPQERSRGTGAGRSTRQGLLEAMAKSLLRSIGSSLGRQIGRGILGSILKGK